MRTCIIVAMLTTAVVMTGLAAPQARAADTLEGRWDASITAGGAEIPFRLDIAGRGDTLTGVLYNGDRPQPTSSAVFKDGSLVLNYEHYLTRIVATLKDGRLEGAIYGRFDTEQYGGSYPFRARRHTPRQAAAVDVPSIGGSWEVPIDSAKGEKAWRFIVKQSGADVSASILRVDGDTGSLTGTYENGTFVLSHFDGSRPGRLEVTPTKEGTLELRQQGPFSVKTPLIAYRPDVARAKGLPAPSNYVTHTTMRDPNEVFQFEFPDVNGNVLSNESPRFKGKVVVAVVTGTWCPNCHDEAQYLVQLHRKYRAQGLEIVALDFEEPEQQDNLERVHAFIKQYGVEYTYLIAGAPTEMWEKVPQAVNLNTWPATFFIGRDGRVKLVHAGFAAPASGEFHEQLQTEFTSTIERLLAEGAPSKHTGSGN